MTADFDGFFSVIMPELAKLSVLCAFGARLSNTSLPAPEIEAL